MRPFPGGCGFATDVGHGVAQQVRDNGLANLEPGGHVAQRALAQRFISLKPRSEMSAVVFCSGWHAEAAEEARQAGEARAGRAETQQQVPIHGEAERLVDLAPALSQILRRQKSVSCGTNRPGQDRVVVRAHDQRRSRDRRRRSAPGGRTRRRSRDAVEVIRDIGERSGKKTSSELIQAMISPARPGEGAVDRFVCPLSFSRPSS
jgi:hypothetical protein